MKIQNEKDLKLFWKGGTAFLFFMAIALVTFFYFVEKDVNKNVEKTLRDNLERQNHHLQTILDLQFQNLENMAESIGHRDELIAEENMCILRVLQKNSDFERVSIIDVEGNSHYDEGSVKNVAHRRYFKEGMAGNRTLSDPLESSIDGQTRVVLGVPIYTDGDKAKEVIGILAASYDMTALSRMMFEDIYGGAGFSMILTRKGEVISYDAGNKAGERALESIGNNLFGKYEEELERNPNASKVVSDFKKGKSGCAELNTGINKWYMAYAPLSYNDWMVCYSIPSESARKAYQFINRYEFVLCIALASAVMILIFGLMKEVRKRQKKLIEYANTDALTGLSNKEKTKNEIEQWLKETEKQSGIQVFMIMDIDYFKEVNDTYGHIAGDLVLQNIGNYLLGRFRDGDILGRVGGDEFVMFMKNVDTVDHMVKKVRKVSEEIPQIVIPDLNGAKVSVSIGVSYAPDCGQTYLDLYHHADEALYETKRKGRNGYTVFCK
ncbi:MAG: diguanylate cyclase [Lachnospiraceae bacterium]|nr:diguanylate cyclase [Lachnospiraceae bacterium]